MTLRYKYSQRSAQRPFILASPLERTVQSVAIAVCGIEQLQYDLLHCDYHRPRAIASENGRGGSVRMLLIAMTPGTVVMRTLLPGPFNNTHRACLTTTISLGVVLAHLSHLLSFLTFSQVPSRSFCLAGPGRRSLGYSTSRT